MLDAKWILRPRDCFGSALLSAILVAGLLLLGSVALCAQTYPLKVQPEIKPQATLILEGVTLKRSVVKDDPGFRLQYHIKKEGKTVASIEARAKQAIEVPQKEAGTYSAVLEVFYPAYKPGNAQKGEFKAISNVVNYKLTPASKPGLPAQVQVLAPPAPVAVLVIQCGKGGGKNQDEKIAKGFAYKLIQGTSLDARPKTTGKTHCWANPKEVRFEISLVPNTAGILRLHFVDGDNGQRKQQVFVQGKAAGDVLGFQGPGKVLNVTLSAAEASTGKIEVRVQNLNPTGNAVVSTVEFLILP